MKVKEKMGLTPSQIIDFKGLAGDSSDNIPGVKGIGEKTKNDLLKTFKSVKRIKEADFAELENSIGKNRASIIYIYFHGTLTPRE